MLEWKNLGDIREVEGRDEDERKSARPNALREEAESAISGRGPGSP